MNPEQIRLDEDAKREKDWKRSGLNHCEIFSVDFHHLDRFIRWMTDDLIPARALAIS